MVTLKLRSFLRENFDASRRLNPRHGWRWIREQESRLQVPVDVEEEGQAAQERQGEESGPR